MDVAHQSAAQVLCNFQAQRLSSERIESANIAQEREKVDGTTGG